MTVNTHDKNTHYCARPCFARSLSLCTTTFLLALLSFLAGAELESNRAIFIIIGALLSALNIFLSVYCIFKLNSKVYITDSEISQHQLGREIKLNFNEITEVKLTHSPLVKAPPLITLSGNDIKISFETTSHLYKFFKECCKNETVNSKLRKVMKDNLIYD